MQVRAFERYISLMFAGDFSCADPESFVRGGPTVFS